MKYLLFTIALFLCVNITAQELPKKSKIFVRVYNNVGKKIAKGKILSITENSLILKKGSSSITIPSNEISYLKTKRSNGNNALLGASGGFILGLSIVAANQDTPTNSASGFTRRTKPMPFSASFFTAAIGYGVGYITTVFKNSKQYIIGGDAQKWQGFKEEIYAPKY